MARLESRNSKNSLTIFLRSTSREAEGWIRVHLILENAEHRYETVEELLRISEIRRMIDGIRALLARRNSNYTLEPMEPKLFLEINSLDEVHYCVLVDFLVDISAKQRWSGGRMDFEISANALATFCKDIDTMLRALESQRVR